MDPQLAKLMARRRRKADGEEGSAGTQVPPKSNATPPPTPPSFKPAKRPSNDASAAAPLSFVHPDGITITSPIQQASPKAETLYSPSVFVDAGIETSILTSPSSLSSSARKKTSRTIKSRLSEEELSELDAVVAAVDASLEVEEPVTASAESRSISKEENPLFIPQDPPCEETSPKFSQLITDDSPPPPPPPRDRVSRPRSVDSSGTKNSHEDGLGTRRHNRRRSTSINEENPSDLYREERERRKSLIHEIEERNSSASRRAGKSKRPPSNKLPNSLEAELMAAAERRSPSKTSQVRRRATSKQQRSSRTHRRTSSSSESDPDEDEKKLPRKSASRTSPGPRQKRNSMELSTFEKDKFGSGVGNEQSLGDLFQSATFDSGRGASNGLSSSAAMSADFGSFPAAFGSATTESFPEVSKRTDSMTSEPFEFLAQQSKKPSTEYEPPPSFDLDFKDGWGKTPPKSYDTSPIDKPPVNLLESASSKIQWMTPFPNMVVSSALKHPNPDPITNPLTGNIILSRPSSPQSYQLIEWDPQRKTQVVASTILTLALKRKIVEKYRVTPATVDRVWKVTSGIHKNTKKSSQGAEMESIRVAALIDLTILGDSKNEVLRVIAVWNWGNNVNGQNPVQLQCVLSPPSGQDFTYDTDSLLVADGCVFVGGSSPRGPCIFLNKPTVRETWSANFIAKNNTELRITHMAVTNCPKSPPDPDATSVQQGQLNSERAPYLAIALDDGSLSVWTYESARKLSGKTKEAVRKLLFPLCRLHATKVLQTCPVTGWSNKEHTVIDGGASGDTNRVGYCTHLEWIPYRASAHKQLLLLAASFQGALCLYHVALPKIPDKHHKGSYIDIKSPTEKTILAQTIALKPFCYSRWNTTGRHQKAFCSFVDMGHHIPPSLVVLLKGLDSNEDYARLALVTSPLPAYIAANSKGKSNNGSSHLSFHVWDACEWTKRATNLPVSLITSSLMKSQGILYYTGNTIQELRYQLSNDSRLSTFGAISGIGSIPFGLTSSGANYWADSAEPSGIGVLRVYSTLHCERFKSSLSQDPSSPTLLEWSSPTRRHWLVQIFVGDSKESKIHPSMNKTSRDEKESDEVVLGGAQSTVMCELVTKTKIQNHYPCRIVRSPYASVGSKGQHIAISFRSFFGRSDPISIGVVEIDGDGQYGVVQLLDGRDMIFLPNSSSTTGEGDESSSTTPNMVAQALVVSTNGGSVSLWQRKGLRGTQKYPWHKVPGSACRPILGNSPSEEGFVELCQYALARFQDQVSLIAIASTASGRYCILSGKLVSEDELQWKSLLPNMKEDPVLYLDDHEQVSIVVPLPGEGSVRGGFGVATTKRLLVLSWDLTILAECRVDAPPGSLVPMGSYTIAYSSHTDHKLRYLSGLPEAMGRSGVIASFPSSTPSRYTHWLAGIRPDRFLFSPYQNGTRMVERGQSSNAFLLPLDVTRPALLLEPLIANAIATADKGAVIDSLLRGIFEKFGRKVATMSHGEGEGIGNFGAGITPIVFELLDHYNLKSAASWLLTGTVKFDRAANSRLLPPYLPITAKSKGAFNVDTHLHLIANGDQYLAEYVKSPDNNMSSTLPLPSDATSSLCRQFAVEALQNGSVSDAVKMLDMTGTQAADETILQLALALQLDPKKESKNIIETLYNRQGVEENPSIVASLAALSAQLRNGEKPTAEFKNQWMETLAPSIQRSRKYGRHRARIIGEASLAKVASNNPVVGELFSYEIPESRLVWNEGPNREKENLLLLGDFKEWFGRRRPVVLGKEGAKSAQERGASTLAGILSNDDEDSFGGDDDDFKDGWVDGVGEGLNDEDKLCGYFRFSEGEGEDSAWREEGVADITKFDNKAIVIGNPDDFDLRESTSSVDEGESGKVKALYDLVFGQSGIGQSSALTIPSFRGGSLDLGIMHGPDHQSRHKLTIEFWVWIPETIKKEIILARRTFGSSASDFDAVCKASDKTNFLWELGLLKDGELEFRTIAGKSIKTSPIKKNDKDDDDDDDSPLSTVHFCRWNHVSIVMKQKSITCAEVSLIIRGKSKIEPKSLSFAPPGFEIDDFSGASAFDPMLEKSQLVFGLDHPKGLRLTELRIWALDRKQDDIKTLMREYLECAEIKKKKFNIKIKKFGAGKSVGQTPPKQGLLRPPLETQKTTGLLAPPVVLKPLNDTKSKKGGLRSPLKQSNDEKALKAATSKETSTAFGDNDFMGSSFRRFTESKVETEDLTPAVSFSSGAFGEQICADGDFRGDNPLQSTRNEDVDTFNDAAVGVDPQNEEEIEISPLWESAIPLSEQVRTSAASALIRGPPATRHFGGNRGGLPDYRELERLGVGAISICGSEKTIVWRDDQIPPGLTYPIGASGAIVSDQMDGDGSEFLCCFMAKDKRMVVFELSTRTVVVELQMTTKLNYWRFLPPEAGEDTLCFMLITPVGGFHWMPLDESPRPRQVWKRGSELQGKKIVCYEEGGANGYEGPDMLSKVGLLLVTDAADIVDGGNLEAWLVPICGDSQVICASYQILGACLCQPPGMEFEPFMPLLLFVVEEDNELIVCVSAVTQESETSIGLTEVMTDALIEQGPYRSFDFEPPALAMGTYPEVLCCSLGTTVVVIVRRKGLVVAYELAESGLELIAQENVGHYVVDAVMRYNAAEGGAEIVLLMSDTENRRDGRVGTFCFRAAC